MGQLLDTSTLLRYLTRDPEHQFEVVRAMIEGTETFEIPVIALSETFYVLSAVYRVPRTEAVDQLVDLIALGNVGTLEIPTDLAREALMLVRPSGRVSIQDALIWAAARAAGSTTVVHSFDRRFPSYGIDLRVPR